MSETRYRIAPHGDRQWKVQFLDWPFWRNVKNWVGYETYSVVAFDTESAAEAWIDGRRGWERELAANEQLARQRKMNIVPREYPAK